MSTLLPFGEFLELLRGKGYGVSLHEYFALANLLERWDGTDAEEFGDALAALIGRNEEEVGGIRRLFAEAYLAPAPLPPAHAPTQAMVVVRRWTWVTAVIAAAVLSATAWIFYRWTPPTPPRPVERASTVEPAPGPQPAITPISLPPPAAPSLPNPPTRADRRVTTEIVGTAFLFAMATFWALKTRHTTNTWLRETWAAVLSSLPGPFQFNVLVRGHSARLARVDIEDAANILARSFAADTQSRELDVERSVRLTLRRSLLPQLVFEPRRMPRPILVFQEVGQDMQVWRLKADAFLTDLVRQGVPLERWYFDGDPRRVADRPYRAAVPFDTVTRRNPSSPVLVVSAGQGLDAALATRDDAWLKALRGVLRKSWLTPVSDLRLWPAAFDVLPLRVWPMTREGLARSAKDLAGIEGEVSPRIRSQFVAAGRVTADDIERMKRLASVVPHPTTELLDALRRQFAPDVPDAAVLHLLAEAGGLSTPVLRLSDAEVKRCLEALRRESPKLEAEVRRTLVGVLRDSQPAPGSAAHQRWQLAVALQELQLADIEGSDASAALETIRTLAQGPLWEEVGAAAERVPMSFDLSRRLDHVLGPTDRKHIRPPGAPPVASPPPPWSWPGSREIVPAAIAASLVLVIGQFFHVFPARALEHLQDAYRLTYAARTPTAQAQLRLQRRSNDPAVPGTVNILQDGKPFGVNVALPIQGTAPVPLTAAATGHYYQARAPLPGGNFAFSNPVWVPSDSALLVSIDALPWANVVLQSDQGTVGPESTPLSASLVPGRYRLHFDNGGVTPPMDQVIDITPSNRVFRFTMPGFDPQQTATQLTPRSPY